MSTGLERTYTTVDKSTWGPGEWQDEPDKVQWTDSVTGFPCLAKRGPGGHWCGYVGVSEGHPSFEKGYDDVRVLDEDGDLDWPDVHGGLTYAARCLCHIPDPGQPDRVWWFGFDCAHLHDMSPAHRARDRQRYDETGDALWLGFGDESYRTLGYVRGQTTELARQLATVKP